MTYLTPHETDLLRHTLGLSKWNKETPGRNFIQAGLVEDIPVIAGLVERGYMKEKVLNGLTRQVHYIATPAGIEAVRDQRWID